MTSKGPVGGITLEQLDRLGVDDENRLYWDGKPVVTERKVTVGFLLNMAAILAAGGTVASAVIDVLEYLRLAGS